MSFLFLGDLGIVPDVEEPIFTSCDDGILNEYDGKEWYFESFFIFFFLLGILFIFLNFFLSILLSIQLN